MIRARSFRAGLILLAVLPGPAAAQRRGPARGSLAGEVLGLEGKAAPGARVLLQSSDGRNPRAAKADANGRFRFRSLRSGLYDVRAQGGGHSSDWEHNVLVRSGREARVMLRLLLKTPPASPPPLPAKPAPSPPKSEPH